MDSEFKVEIVNPEKLFVSKEDAIEVVVPAYEGDMGILRDHISIISFLKPGVIKILSKNEEEKYYVDDGIIEFKDNSLSILTSSICNLKDMNRNIVENYIKDAEKILSDGKLNDQKKFLIDQKIDVLKSLAIN